MKNFFSDMLQSDPHSLEEIRASLNEALTDGTDYIALLKRHHDFLEESIAVVTDEDATDPDKQAHLIRFFKLVEMH